MNRLIKRASIAALGAALLIGCSNDDDTDDLGNWVTSTVFDGPSRSSAVVFTQGDYAYAGTGYDGDDYLKDFWKYNIEGGYWEQVADFPGEPRSSAAAFSIGDVGYVGTGYNGTDELSDFYKYDIQSGTWTPIAPLGGNARRAAVGFSSTTAGYIGSGFDGNNDRKDFWKYNPADDSWQEIFGFGGNKRREAVTFTIDNTVYFGTGITNGTHIADFWKFNTTTETWTRLRDIDDNSDDSYDDDYSIIRAQATGFTMGNYGYICGGDSSNSVWEYDPNTDLWDSKTNFEASSRVDAIAFSNGMRGFVALGKSGEYYFDDMMEFRPFDEQEDND